MVCWFSIVSFLLVSISVSVDGDEKENEEDENQDVNDYEEVKTQACADLQTQAYTDIQTQVYADIPTQAYDPEGKCQYFRRQVVTISPLKLHKLHKNQLVMP